MNLKKILFLFILNFNGIINLYALSNNDTLFIEKKHYTLFQPLSINEFSLGTGLSYNFKLNKNIFVSIPINIYYQRDFSIFYKQYTYFGFALNLNTKYQYFHKKKKSFGIGLNLRKNFIDNIHFDYKTTHQTVYNKDISFYPELVNFIDLKWKKYILRTNLFYGLKYNSFYKSVNSSWRIEFEIGKIYH